MDTQMVMILAGLSRSIDNLYDCVSGVVIIASELTDLTKAMILVVERDFWR